MRRQQSGFVLIEALLGFLMVSLIVALLAKSAISMGMTELQVEGRRSELEEREWQWWQESNGGCRDTCLIDAVVYPWN